MGAQCSDRLTVCLAVRPRKGEGAGGGYDPSRAKRGSLAGF